MEEYKSINTLLVEQAACMEDILNGKLRELNETVPTTVAQLNKSNRDIETIKRCQEYFDSSVNKESLISFFEFLVHFNITLPGKIRRHANFHNWCMMVENFYKQEQTNFIVAMTIGTIATLGISASFLYIGMLWVDGFSNIRLMTDYCRNFLNALDNGFTAAGFSVFGLGLLALLMIGLCIFRDDVWSVARYLDNQKAITQKEDLEQDRSKLENSVEEVDMLDENECRAPVENEPDMQ
jgi:hypothetical protein